MENFTYFTTGGVESPYASLPKYEADENAVTFDEDDRQEQTTEDNKTEDSNRPTDAIGDSIPELQQSSDSAPPPSSYKKKSKKTKARKLRRHFANDTSNRFADEIHPPSLFSHDVPSAFSGMQGPVKYNQNFIQTPSVFVRPENTTPQSVGQTTSQPTLYQISASLPGSILLPGQQVHPTVPRMSTSFSGYLVPNQIAQSMGQKETLIRSDISVESELNLRTLEDGKSIWDNCFPALTIIITTLLIGAIVAAIVMAAL